MVFPCLHYCHSDGDEMVLFHMHLRFFIVLTVNLCFLPFSMFLLSFFTLFIFCRVSALQAIHPRNAHNSFWEMKNWSNAFTYFKSTSTMRHMDWNITSIVLTLSLLDLFSDTSIIAPPQTNECMKWISISPLSHCVRPVHPQLHITSFINADAISFDMNSMTNCQSLGHYLTLKQA